MSSRRHAKSTKQSEPLIQRIPRRSSPFAHWLAPPVLIISLITAFGACGNGKPSGVVETEAIAECDAYASAFNACMSHLGTAANGSAERHLAPLRQQVSASTDNEAERERLRASCVFSMNQLELACR